MDSITYILGKGAPGLLNLRLPVYRAHILVNGPGMLYGRMRFLTSLGLHDGCTFARLSVLASSLRVVALCGHAGAREVPVEVVSTRIGARVEFGVGPMGMYQSELVLSTADDRPFDEVLRRIFGERAETALFGLEPLPGEGHHGGTAHGGVAHGEPHHGGMAHGEPHHGGAAQGGVAHGGAAQGGMAHGGVAQGGVAQGGAAQGGMAHGGVAQGGTAHGGTVHGGAAQGGAAHGDAAQGGPPGGHTHHHGTGRA